MSFSKPICTWSILSVWAVYHNFASQCSTEHSLGHGDRAKSFILDETVKGQQLRSPREPSHLLASLISPLCLMRALGLPAPLAGGQSSLTEFGSIIFIGRVTRDLFADSQL